MGLGAARMLPRCRSKESGPALHGLIQHSFALQIDREHRPFHGATTDDRVRERFEAGIEGFKVLAAGDLFDGGEDGEIADHSPLVRDGRTSLHPLPAPKLHVLPNRQQPSLPNALKWAAEGRGRSGYDRADEVKFLFAQAHGEGRISHNDFLVRQAAEGMDEPPAKISRLLLELIAHRRSRLFGLSLASRIGNVMLPHATLRVVGSTGRCRWWTGGADRRWFLQPLVSAIRDGQNEHELRSTYTLSLLLVPIKGRGWKARKMRWDEIEETVNAGWGLAAGPPSDKIPKFGVGGPLVRYIAELAPSDARDSLWPTAESPSNFMERPLTLRQLTEAVAFAVGLRMAEGPAGRAAARTKRRIADDVVAALGSARVSSVVVADPTLGRERVRKPVRSTALPGLLAGLMKRLSGPPRSPNGWTPRDRRRYRLDRPFVDDATYVVGVLPHNRCLVVASAQEAQHGVRESALMQAGSVAYMTIGAANAIGTMRAIDRDLEKMEDADPSKIAKVEAEIAADVHEIFDLDITRETYRQLYHRLRDRLGIDDDYKTLQDKMGSLYRATTTLHEKRSQLQLAWLTAAIVVLSLLILIGTIALAVKPDAEGAAERASTPVLIEHRAGNAKSSAPPARPQPVARSSARS
jgi:hypothetical protein